MLVGNGVQQARPAIGRGGKLHKEDFILVQPKIPISLNKELQASVTGSL